MIITIPWLKEHLKTSAKESEIIDQLTNIGLEVEGIKENSGEMGKFKIAKVLKAEKHPNADKLKVCDVTIGGKEILKVVCGAPNAREVLITIYAPPGAVIPKTNFELKVAKIRGVESKGMLCSESELNLSALGCFSAFKTFAILNLPISPAFSLMPSTSSPIFVRWSIISFSLAVVLRCSLSQGIVIIIYLALYSLLEHLMGQIQNDLAIYNQLRRKLLNH